MLCVALGGCQAVPVTGKAPDSTGKVIRFVRTAASTFAACLVGAGALAQSLPSGGAVVAGNGTIAQVGNVMTVTQTTPKMAADWQSFNIGAGNTLNFVQPSTNSVALNRVLGNDVSLIQGALKANGQVFLVNPNGVLFTPSAQVNVGSLVGSTLGINTTDFMGGSYKFDSALSNIVAGSAIVNQGNITTGNGGSIALIAAKITNTGTLTAKDGNVLMGAGSKVTLDLGGPVKLQVTQGAIDTLVENGGAIKADGGLAYLTAKAADDLAVSVINNTGVIEAQTLAIGKNGRIMLMGDMQVGNVNVGGVLDASASNGGNGGFIETSAAHVKIADSVKVTTLATDGYSGTWLIDPANFNIGNSVAGAVSNLSGSTLSFNLEDGNVEILSSGGAADGSGDINVNEAVSWSVNKLTLTAARDININAVMTASGSSTLNLNTATANGGDAALVGGQVYVGMDSRSFIGQVNFAEADGSLIRTGANILTINAAGYNLISTPVGLNTTGNHALSYNVDLTGTAFTPISSYTGKFNGLGHTITGMNINGAAAANTGMIKIAGAASDIRNVGLARGIVSNGGAGTGALIGSGTTGVVSNSYNTGIVTGTAGTGGLVGSMTTGSIANSFTSGTVTGAAGTGGLVGSMTTGSIVNGQATGNVTGAAGTGGLVGATTGGVTDSLASGNVTGAAGTGGLVGTTTGGVTDSFASGNVTGAAGTGGLVGTTTGAVNKSYATGNIIGAAGTGGLVGTATGNISNSYASGNATAEANVDGIAGSSTGLITNVFWDNTKNLGIGNAGSTAITTAIMKTLGAFTSWDFANIWYMDAGKTYPLLRSFMTAITVTVNSLTKTYHGVAYTGGYSAKYSVSDAALDGTLAYTGTSQHSVNAGNYIISPNGLVSNQQYLISYADGALNIAKADITITANAQTKAYGDADPELTYQVISGNLIAGDSLSGTMTRTAGEDVGSYTISAGALTNDNYLISTNNGILKILRDPVLQSAFQSAQTAGFSTGVPTTTNISLSSSGTGDTGGDGGGSDGEDGGDGGDGEETDEEEEEEEEEEEDTP